MLRTGRQHHVGAIGYPGPPQTKTLGGMVELWQTMFRVTGLQDISFPWVGVFLCNLAFVVVSLLLALASMRVHRETRLSLKARAWIVLGLVGVLGVSMIVAWPLSWMSAAQAGLLKDPWFQAYVFALNGLSVVPMAFVSWRAGYFRENAT